MSLREGNPAGVRPAENQALTCAQLAGMTMSEPHRRTDIVSQKQITAAKLAVNKSKMILTTRFAVAVIGLATVVRAVPQLLQYLFSTRFSHARSLQANHVQVFDQEAAASHDNKLLRQANIQVELKLC
ncbi:hypothetical protein HJFPF1_03657 [Paramyrothecium foliicola]|nr:hypothetical protein HJFPF1_03657 [Paramyrothecium foliicola]